MRKKSKKTVLCVRSINQVTLFPSLCDPITSLEVVDPIHISVKPSKYHK